ncbi:hypothetical protein [Spirosoma sp. KNUC1025]|uniref:hypothetical protein n=1 Tax=Spirosoma sp. KNUC1025 TaxID=2894082 RepID=UPI00386B8283|nr:hypothetical protein LN737_19100 [Spirosoma sp. KNUC1025]
MAEDNNTNPAIYPTSFGLFPVHPVPEPFLNQIGDLTVSFSLLEEVIKDLVRLCIKHTDRVIQIITAELSFKNIRALVINLFSERGKTDQYYLKVKELMKRAAFIEERRNQIIHGSWLAGSNENHIKLRKITAKEGKGLIDKQLEISLELLSDLVLYVKHLTGDFIEFSHDFALVTNQHSLLRY